MKNIWNMALVSIGLTASAVAFSDPVPPSSPNVYAAMSEAEQLSTNAQLAMVEAEVNAMSAENTTEQMEISSEIQQINQAISEQNKSANKSSTAKDFSLAVNVAMITVGIVLNDPAILATALISLKIEKPNTLYVIGMNGDTLEKTMADPSQFQVLRTILKKAASTYAPHVYVAGTVTPGYIRDLMRLAVQEKVVYEPANISFEQMISGVNDAVALGQRIDISTATMPDTPTESSELDNAILRVLSRINFVAVNGNYVNIRPEKTRLRIEFFEGRNHHRVLSKMVDVSNFTPAQVVDIVRTLVKNYRQSGKVNHMAATPTHGVEKTNTLREEIETHAIERR